MYVSMYIPLDYGYGSIQCPSGFGSCHIKVSVKDMYGFVFYEERDHSLLGGQSGVCVK